MESGTFIDIITCIHVIHLINAKTFHTCFDLKVIQDQRKWLLKLTSLGAHSYVYCVVKLFGNEPGLVPTSKIANLSDFDQGQSIKTGIEVNEGVQSQNTELMKCCNNSSTGLVCFNKKCKLNSIGFGFLTAI